jgi:hypothetical protein
MIGKPGRGVLKRSKVPNQSFDSISNFGHNLVSSYSQLYDLQRSKYCKVAAPVHVEKTPHCPRKVKELPTSTARSRLNWLVPSISNSEEKLKWMLSEIYDAQLARSYDKI